MFGYATKAIGSTITVVSEGSHGDLRRKALEIDEQGVVLADGCPRIIGVH